MQKKEAKPEMKEKVRPRQMKKEARNEGKRETKTNAKGGKPQSTALCVGAHMPRGRVGTGGIPARGRLSNHGDDGGTQKGTLCCRRRQV